ncbi:MAG: F0F1 ATP synthase subunit A [Flavobacteriales bacterium]|nr:F0F1 ATP synthase subunit A [Flavobacteriales bacterium]
MVHFNWTQLIPMVGHEYIHVATALVALSLIILLSFVGRLALGNGEHAVIPAGKVSFKGLFEVIFEFVNGMAETVVGSQGKKYVPLFGAIFCYVFINNLLGLLPGMTPATDNLNTTIAVGFFSFIAYNYYGLRENGLGYLKHFLGPIWWLAWFMVVLETVSHLVRPVSLGLRLYGNMVGDHTVLSLFLDLAGYFLVPVIFYFLGMFVCFMQAFVFMMLTMIYVSMAISHDH